MTTKVTVETNHGCPVDVFAHDKIADGSKTLPVVLLGRVGVFSKQDFYVHSLRDLLIHEVQPAELAEEQARTFDPSGATEFITVFDTTSDA